MKPNKPATAQPLAFTLVEAVIVVAVIGILLSAAVPMYKNIRNSARDSEAFLECTLIASAVEQLGYDTGVWPVNGNVGAIAYSITNFGSECWDLNTTNAGLTQYGAQFDVEDWKGPYMSTNRPDPWGTAYFLDTDYTLVLEHTVSGGAVTGAVVGSFGANRGEVGTYNDWRPGYTSNRLDNSFDVIKRQNYP